LVVIREENSVGRYQCRVPQKRVVGNCCS